MQLIYDFTGAWGYFMALSGIMKCRDFFEQRWESAVFRTIASQVHCPAKNTCFNP